MNIVGRLRSYLGQTSRTHHSAPREAALGSGTVTLPGFLIEVRLGPSEQRVRTGRDSVLGCHFVLERGVGAIEVGDRTYIGGTTRIVCAQHVSIGSDVLIAWGCTIVDHDSHSLTWAERSKDVETWRSGLERGGLAGAAGSKNWSVVPTAAVRIEDKAWLGFNVIVLKGVTIGQGAVVAAGSVVTDDVPAWTLAAGNPARVIKELPRP